MSSNVRPLEKLAPVLRIPAFVRRRVRKSLTNGLLAPVGALIDLTRLESRTFLATPLNGQSGRRAIVDDVIARTDAEVIVESGTFRGATTDYFSRVHGGSVISIEATSRFLFAARFRLRRRRNVRLLHSDSRSGLRKLASEPNLVRRPTLFYLDAHWHDDLPLAEEIAIVNAGWSNWVAIVDDFAVPDDPGYAFDDYGPGKALDVGYLREIPVPVWCFWPRLRSKDEDGMVRGCVVITSVREVAVKLQASSLLRTISGVATAKDVLPEEPSPTTKTPVLF
jgi:hypothetical protein